jgi:transposase
VTGLAEILEENRRLRDALAATQAELAAKKYEIATREAMYEALKSTAEDLARHLELLKLKASGAASQRFVVPANQELLRFPGDIKPPPRAPQRDDNEDTDETNPQPRPTGQQPRRRKRNDYEGMPSRKVTAKVLEGSTCHGCGGVLGVIGQATSFRVEWIPGHFLIEDVIRDKCACPNCPDQGVLTVPAPYALDRALCGNGLLARVMVDKFCDHIPLNRQAKRMAREGFDVGSNTLAGWIKGGASLLTVLAQAVRRSLLSGDYLQGDDTGFPVQDSDNGMLRKGRLWAFTDQQQVFYAFTPTKEGIFPTQLLDGFKGDLLLVDGGAEFNEVVRQQGLERGGCWSHLRTYFYDARHHHPTEAALALGTIRDLFLIERTLHGKPADQVVALRQETSATLIDGFFHWVRAISTMTRPKSTLGDAVRYALNQEKALRLHLDHGELPMHNNTSELMLRQAVVGRKNWLFARSEGGADAAATIYTLVGSCMLQGIDPHTYLDDILDRLPDHPISRVDELTPQQWRRARQGHTAPMR